MTKPTLWGCISPINKKVVLLFFSYALSTNTLRRTENRFLLNDFNTYPQTKNSDTPTPISSLMPTQWAKAGHTSYFSTHSLTTLINSVFKKIGLLPTWSERFGVEIIKEILVLVFFTMWYEKKIIRKSWISYSMKHPDELKNLLKNFNPKEKTNHLLEAFLKNTQISFKTWVLCKTIQTGLWNTVVNLIISIPAWYKVGKFFHQTYRNIWPSQKQGSSS